MIGYQSDKMDFNIFVMIMNYLTSYDLTFKNQ